MLPLRLTTDFECSNAENVISLSSTSFQITCRPDMARNIEGNWYASSDYYYAFRLHNDNAEPVEAHIEAITHMFESYHNQNYCHRTVAIRPVPSSGKTNCRDWMVLPPEQEDVDRERSMTLITLTVPPLTTLDVTSMYWYSASEAEARLLELAALYPQLRLESLGKTAEGRDIWAASLPCEGRKRAVIAATPQCSECGTMAVMGMLEAALRGELEATKRYALTFVPVTNPDGNALGRCMTNALYENIVFGFLNPVMPVECDVMWKLTHEKPLAFYLEMHSYPHQDRPSFRSYEFDPILYPDTDSRYRGMRYLDAIKRVSPNPTVYLALNSEMDANFSSSLVGRLVREGIPATLYKLHTRETPSANISHSIRILESIAKEEL